MKKTPGPRAPPDNSRPSLKMTALSYSCTTFTTNRRESGRETRISTMEMKVRRWAHSPGPSLQSSSWLWGGFTPSWLGSFPPRRDLRTDTGLSCQAQSGEQSVLTDTVRKLINDTFFHSSCAAHLSYVEHTSWCMYSLWIYMFKCFKCETYIHNMHIDYV